MDTPTQPDFPPPLPPEPPKPAKSLTNAVIIGSAAAVIAAIVATGIVVVNSRDDDSNSPATAGSSTPADDTITAAAEPVPTPEDTGPEVWSLTDGVSWDGGVEVELTGWTRGVTGPYAAPQSTPFVKFTVKIRNKGDQTVDVSSGYLTCLYGDDGQESAQVFDSERGLDGLPQVHLRPGKSVSAKTGCELPKGEEYLQVELSPTAESETAIFAGNVK
ncbi:DUF4352 domain-containing protein [Streptomyces luteogriseus]